MADDNDLHHPDRELDALVKQLNEAAKSGDLDRCVQGEALHERPMPARQGWSLPPAELEAGDGIATFLAEARLCDASDLLIVSGSPPMARIDGALTALGRPLTGVEARALCAEITPGERRGTLKRLGAVDFAFTKQGLGRFRCNVHRQGGNWAASIRLLPTVPPDFEELHLPSVLEILTELEHGLVLVTGPTGSGKSTTLASMMRMILEKRTLHAITVEDPVEYEHRSDRSVVEHIEIGRDALSFPQALRSALRQDPDLLLVGEMRDQESIAMAITAAETGHLVLSTLHTGDVVQSINRIIDTYPPEQIDTVRTQLSISLSAVISQTLIPRADGNGRVPAVEVMFATDAIRNLVRNGKVEQIRSQMEIERKTGMMPMDHSLAALVRDGLIKERDARLRARNLELFSSLLK